MKYCKKMPICQNRKVLRGSEGGQRMLTPTRHGESQEGGHDLAPQVLFLEFMNSCAMMPLRAVEQPKGSLSHQRRPGPPVLTSSKSASTRGSGWGFCLILAGIGFLRVIVMTSPSSRGFGEARGGCLAVVRGCGRTRYLLSVAVGSWCWQRAQGLAGICSCRAF